MADNDLLSTLQPPQPPPPATITQFPPLGQLGVALSGLAAGVRGEPNPALAQLQSQQDTRFHQQTQLFALRQSVERSRQARQKLELDLYRDLLGGPSPEGRKLGATGIGAYLQKTTGQPISPDFVKSFEAGTLSLDQRKQAYISILAAEHDPTLAGGIDHYLTSSLRVPPAMIPSLKAEAKSDPIHKLLYGKTLTQETLDLAKAEREERRVIVLEARQQVAELREARAERRGAKADERAEARLALAERAATRADNQFELSEKRFEWLQAKGPEEKRLKGLDQAELLANQLSSTAIQLETLHYLPPPHAGVFHPQYLAARARRVAYPNEPAWQLWSRHLQPAMVGYARSVQNDIGPRAIMAFQGAIRLMENPPDLDSIQTVVANMRKAIALGREGKDTAQFVLIRKPDGTVLRAPWKRGMEYAPGDLVVGIE